jgi:hypothetical protein
VEANIGLGVKMRSVGRENNFRFPTRAPEIINPTL